MVDLNSDRDTADAIRHRGAIFRFSLIDNFNPGLIKFFKYLEAL